MNYLELLGTIIGVIYLYFEYKASIYLWIAGIIMPAIYIFIYYQAGLYADFGINIYYLLAAIYGWWYWLKGKKNRTEEAALAITKTPLKKYLPLTAVFISTFLIIGVILITFTDSNVPWWDSFTTALSIIGMWMLARKYLEQWIPWIIVDAVSCGLYLYKELYFTAILYGAYAVIAIFGFLKWKKMMNNRCKGELYYD